MDITKFIRWILLWTLRIQSIQLRTILVRTPFWSRLRLTMSIRANLIKIIWQLIKVWLLRLSWSHKIVLRLILPLCSRLWKLLLGTKLSSKYRVVGELPSIIENSTNCWRRFRLWEVSLVPSWLSSSSWQCSWDSCFRWDLLNIISTMMMPGTWASFLGSSRHCSQYLKVHLASPIGR